MGVIRSNFMTIRYKKPDTKNAESIVNAAIRDMDFTLTLKPNELSAPTIIKNVYESFRMLGDALLVANGKISKDHPEQIKALLRLNVNTERPLRLLESLMIARHNLNYYGYKPSILEAEDALDFARKCFKPVVDTVSKEIKK